jgi:hypothetical protein
MRHTGPFVIGLAIGLLLACGAPATAAVVSVTFGSNNDGLGGFTQSTVATPYTNSNSGNTIPSEIWTTNTESVQYRNQDQGTRNSSFLRSVPLDRSSGKAYTVTGVVTLTDGYADDNNRVGLYFFGDSAEVPNEDEVGAIGLIFNADDSSSGGSPGGNNPDGFSLRVGIDSTSLSSDVVRNQTPTPYAQDLFGTELTMSADVAFVGANIQIDAVITDSNGATTVIPTLTVAAADYTGDYFGFVTRARARLFDDTAAGTDTGRSLPWVMDYESFSIVEVPEPASFLMAGLAGLLTLGRRGRVGRRA